MTNPIYFSTTIIITSKDGRELNGNATGFFYVDINNNLFLVTNKHVIYGIDYLKNPTLEIDEFELTLHVDKNDLSKNEAIKISLFDIHNRGYKLWLEHIDSNIDVVVLPINIDRNKYFIEPINDYFFESKNMIIDFEKIFVMGYPHGWYDELNNLPITRIGHLSSPFNIDFNGKPRMLGDVETHPGMSGGPVFMLLSYYMTYLNNVYLGTPKTILVGIFSGGPNIVNRGGKLVSHSLITIWNYRLIREIISAGNDSRF